MNLIKNIGLLGMMLLASTQVSAQKTTGKQVKEDIVQNTKFGGYVIGKASATDQDLNGSTKSHTDFDLRLVRAYVDGKVLDFKYKLQVELNGVSGSSAEKGPRIVDAWAEWQRYTAFRVKFGQFKRAFTFENPMNPWDIGFGAYSQLITKLAGMSDRLGEQSSGGRDIGLQVQGDLLPIAGDKHNFLHYQVGVYNGQGINHKDENRSKDVIGGVYFYPIKELAIGAFGWAGEYTKNGISVDRNRMAYGLKYDGAWKVRAEYASSQGHKLSDYKEDGSVVGTGKADAWYVAVGAPLGKKCQLWGKWDVYRDQKEWSSQKQLYVLAANYYFYKNLKLQANYTYTHDKSTAFDGHYNTFEMQLYWRF